MNVTFLFMSIQHSSTTDGAVWYFRKSSLNVTWTLCPWWHPIHTMFHLLFFHIKLVCFLFCVWVHRECERTTSTTSAPAQYAIRLLQFVAQLALCLHIQYYIQSQYTYTYIYSYLEYMALILPFRVIFVCILLYSLYIHLPCVMP